MNLREIRKRVASLVYVLLVFNIQVRSAVARHLNASYKEFKYRNMLQITREMNKIAYETIEEFKSQFLFGYHDRGLVPVCNVTKRFNANMTEKEKLLENEKNLRVFLQPLNKLTTEVKKRTNANHVLSNLTLVRYKFIDLILTIKYVESHLHDGNQNSNKNKPSTSSTSTFSQPPGITLGDKIVSLLGCLKEELFYSSRFYDDEIKELKNPKYKFR